MTSTYAPNRKIPKNQKYKVIIAAAISIILYFGSTIRQRKAQIVNNMGQFIGPKGIKGMRSTKNISY